MIFGAGRKRASDANHAAARIEQIQSTTRDAISELRDACDDLELVLDEADKIEIPDG